MRLGILSDTHDQLLRTRRAVELLRREGAEALVHCGDLVGPEIVSVCAELPCYFAFGNHDSDTVPTLRKMMEEMGAICLSWGGVVELAGKRIGVTHGHMSTDVRRLLATQPHYLLSGHSHIASDRRDGAVRRINPGALDEADAFTVALLDLERDAVRFLPVPY
jgi:putative phosphoesterase